MSIRRSSAERARPRSSASGTLRRQTPITRPRGTGCAQRPRRRGRALAQVLDHDDGRVRQAVADRARQLVEGEAVAGQVGAEQDRRPAGSLDSLGPRAHGAEEVGEAHGTGTSRASRSTHAVVTRASAT